jgi:predicted pyridoxine 5'-phosphate oxidase superfamily flavin-nucleotide-binding protein
VGILTDDMQRVVREQTLGFIATVCPDGTPNLSPKGTTAVWDDDHLIFLDICSPQTVANLAANAAIEINVVDPVVRKGYRFKGRASVHSDGLEFADVVDWYVRERGSDATRIRAVAIMTVEFADALISPGYVGDVTEADMRDRYARRLEAIHGWEITAT